MLELTRYGFFDNPNVLEGWEESGQAATILGRKTKWPPDDHPCAVDEALLLLPTANRMVGLAPA